MGNERKLTTQIARETLPDEKCDFASTFSTVLAVSAAPTAAHLPQTRHHAGPRPTGQLGRGERRPWHGNVVVHTCHLFVWIRLAPFPFRPFYVSWTGVVALAPGASATQAELIAFCRARIAGYKCPKSITLRSDELPLSATSKIDKIALCRELEAAETASAT